MQDHDPLWEKHFPGLAACTDVSVRRLRDRARLVHVPAGCTVFHRGSACGQYYLMTEGSARVQFVTARGREILLYRAGPGSSCILTTACLLGNNDYPAEAVTESPLGAFAIPAADFHRAMEQSGVFRGFVFTDFAARLVRVISRIEELVTGDIDQRLARVLLAAPGPILRTHNDLAVEIGTAREVVSRHLKRFQHRGWVQLGRASIEITDATALRELAERREDSFASALGDNR